MERVIKTLDPQIAFGMFSSFVAMSDIDLAERAATFVERFGGQIKESIK